MSDEPEQLDQSPLLIDMPTPKKPPHKHRKKTLVIIACVLVAVLTIATFLVYKQKNAPSSEQSTFTKSNNKVAAPQKTAVRIVATGDVIAHDAINAAAKNSGGNYDYLQFMDKMQPYFAAADVRFCNQATLAAGEEFGISGYPIFNAPTQLANDIASVGCNVINTGSNHANDKSQAALEASRSAWDAISGILAVSGTNRSDAEKQKIRYFEIDSVKFAFLSYTTYLNSPNKESYSVTMYSPELAKSQISEAKKNADIVMVSMRWGTEYSTGINSSQTTQSQYLADLGADIVLGHGPHVLEPVKKLKGSEGNTAYVWYSLGNFLNAQLDIESLTSGLAVMDVHKETKEIAYVGFLPIYMHYEWSASDKAADNLLARKNFEMYLLEDAAEPLAKSQNKTTVEAEMARIKKRLNTYTQIPILTGEEYLSN